MHGLTEFFVLSRTTREKMTLKAYCVHDAQVHARDRQTFFALLKLLGLEEIETVKHSQAGLLKER